MDELCLYFWAVLENLEKMQLEKIEISKNIIQKSFANFWIFTSLQTLRSSWIKENWYQNPAKIKLSLKCNLENTNSKNQIIINSKRRWLYAATCRHLKNNVFFEISWVWTFCLKFFKIQMTTQIFDFFAWTFIFLHV